MEPTRKRSRKSPAKSRPSRLGAMDEAGSYLDGQLLIAMPVMDDERFARSVIYVCAHSSEGAMGIIVNRRAGSIDFPELLAQLDIIDDADNIKLPESAESMKVLKGGAGGKRAAALCCIPAIFSLMTRRCRLMTASA